RRRPPDALLKNNQLSVNQLGMNSVYAPVMLEHNTENLTQTACPREQHTAAERSIRLCRNRECGSAKQVNALYRATLAALDPVAQSRLRSLRRQTT
ncbi:MAG: hypothetical protein KDA85_12845, partial [Planctomycetaceae bacterium]|nr:hypothetical protein [Planctomycetaceae bacterium]